MGLCTYKIGIHLKKYIIMMRIQNKIYKKLVF